MVCHGCRDRDLVVRAVSGGRRPRRRGLTRVAAAGLVARQPTLRARPRSVEIAETAEPLLDLALLVVREHAHRLLLGRLVGGRDLDTERPSDPAGEVGQGDLLACAGGDAGTGGDV